MLTRLLFLVADDVIIRLRPNSDSFIRFRFRTAGFSLGKKIPLLGKKFQFTKKRTKLVQFLERIYSLFMEIFIIFPDLDFSFEFSSNVFFFLFQSITEKSLGLFPSRFCNSYYTDAIHPHRMHQAMMTSSRLIMTSSSLLCVCYIELLTFNVCLSVRVC